MVVRESRAQACIRPHETADRIESPNPLSPKGLGVRGRGRFRNSLTTNDLPFKKTLKKTLTLRPYRVILLEVSERKQPKIRKQVKWNTGERIHKTKKGKGSYDRKTDKPKENN